MEACNLTCLPAQHFSINILTQSCYHIVAQSILDKYSCQSSQCNTKCCFQSYNVHSCTVYLFDETVFRSNNNKHKNTNDYQSICLSCFEVIICLSCQACVSLFDDDSLPKRQQEHDIINHHQSTFLSFCFNLWLSCQACISLFDDDSLPNNSNMLHNRCSINIINPWFPICLFNWCAVIFNFANQRLKKYINIHGYNELINNC